MQEPDPKLLRDLIAASPDFIRKSAKFSEGMADVEAMMELYHSYAPEVRVLGGLNFSQRYRDFAAKHSATFRDGVRVRMAATFFQYGFAPSLRPRDALPIVNETDTFGRVAIVYAHIGRLWVCCENEPDAVTLALALSS